MKKVIFRNILKYTIGLPFVLSLGIIMTAIFIPIVIIIGIVEGVAYILGDNKPRFLDIETAFED